MADSWTVAVALALVISGLPQTVRARDPLVDPVIAEADEPGATPTELLAPPTPALAEARRLEDEGRFIEAAKLHETTWQATADPRFLYLAAMAHARAGHHALALQRLEQCFQVLSAAGQVTEPVREHLMALRGREQAATVLVHFMVLEAGASGAQTVPDSALQTARLLLRQLGPTGEPVPGNSFEWVGRPPGGVHLDRGTWQLQIEAPGFMPTTAHYVVSETVAPWPVQVRRRKVVVDLRFSPERALHGARLRLQAIDHTSPLGFERELLAPTTTVMLTSGPWRLQVRARRHAADLDLSIAPGQRPVDVVLGRRTRVDDPRLASTRKLEYGIFGAFLVTWITGGGLMLGAAHIKKGIEKRDAKAYADAGADPNATGELDAATQAAIESDYPAAQLHRDLRRAGDFRTAGAVLMGVGVGTMVALLPLTLRARRGVAVVELGLGGALLAGGGGWLAAALGQRERLLADPEQRVSLTQLDRGKGSPIAASVFAGVGLGLVVFSGIALLHDAADRRRRARAFATAPWAAPGLAGLSLTGRF